MKALLLAVMAAAVLVACSTGVTNQALDDTTTPSSTSSTEAATPPTQFPPASEQLAACTAADPTDVAMIEASLTGGAQGLGKAYVEADGGRRYVAANILDATGDRLSSADYWIFHGSALYALSSSAEDYSTASSAKDRWPTVIAESSEIQVELTRCVIAAGRADAGY